MDVLAKHQLFCRVDYEGPTRVPSRKNNYQHFSDTSNQAAHANLGFEQTDTADETFEPSAPTTDFASKFE